MPVHMWPTSHRPQCGPQATDLRTQRSVPQFGLGTYNPSWTCPCGRDVLPWAQLLLHPAPGLTLWVTTTPNACRAQG